MTQFDVAKVTAIITEAEVAAEAQRLVVEKLHELVDAQERELRRRVDRVEQMRTAWEQHGIPLPKLIQFDR